MWPFTPTEVSKDDIRLSIEAQLPTLQRANELVRFYVDNITWYSMPISQQQIDDELLPSLYERVDSARVTQDKYRQSDSKVDLHDLSLLFMVFACGASADHDQEPRNAEGQMYYHLARVALGLQPIFESVSLSTVQTLVLMALYDIIAIRKNDLEESWKMVFFATVIASSVCPSFQFAFASVYICSHTDWTS